MTALPAADLQAVVRGLEQALAQQQVVTEEAQARALHAQQQVQEAHTLTDHLRKASQANDTALTSLKVLWHVPCSVYLLCCSSAQYGKDVPITYLVVQSLVC